MELDRIVAGDCLDQFPGVDRGVVDLVFADPPFNIGHDYDVYHDIRPVDEYLNWCLKWGGEVARVLKPDGSFWLAIGDELAAEMKVLFARSLGFSFRTWVIWYYTFGVNCVAGFSRSHTHLLHFVKDPKHFTFNALDIKVPSARQLVYNDKRAKAGGRLPDNTWILRPQDVEGGFPPDADTWHAPRVCGTFKERAGFHGCQMPELVLERIILASSNPGEVVLDPFAGSGTTLVAAKRLGRRYVGYELSGEYAEKARLRVDSAEAEDPPGKGCA